MTGKCWRKSVASKAAAEKFHGGILRPSHSWPFYVAVFRNTERTLKTVSIPVAKCMHIGCLNPEGVCGIAIYHTSIDTVFHTYNFLLLKLIQGRYCRLIEAIVEVFSTYCCAKIGKVTIHDNVRKKLRLQRVQTLARTITRRVIPGFSEFSDTPVWHFEGRKKNLGPETGTIPSRDWKSKMCQLLLGQLLCYICFVSL